MAKSKQKNIRIDLKHSMNVTKWFKPDNINWFPNKNQKEIFDDPEKVARDLIFSHSGPNEPFMKYDDNIVTLGSCFAKYLQQSIDHAKNIIARDAPTTGETRGETRVISIPEDMNNTFAIAQYFEWVFTGNMIQGSYWYVQGENGPSLWRSDAERENVKEYLQQVKLFVITIGVAEVWRDKETGGVFWRGMPAEIHNADRHEAVMSTVDENTENLRHIENLIYEHVPDASIVFSLSPVPINASYLDQPAFISDCVSKSVNRVALDVFFQTAREKTYYWPSFEMIRWVGGHLEGSTFWDGHSLRHPNYKFVRMIMAIFFEKFFIAK